MVHGMSKIEAREVKKPKLKLEPLTDREFIVLESLMKYIIIKPLIKVNMKITLPPINGFTQDEIIKCLNSLVKKGYAISKILDRAIACPYCNSLNIVTKYTCPKCGNINITRTHLIQHKRCGYVDTELKFEKEGKLVCPKCRVPVSRDEVVIIASLFECLVCGYRTSTPNIVHKCEDCGTMFLPRQANYVPIYGFELRDEVLELIMSKDVLLETVKSVVTDLGIAMESNEGEGPPLKVTIGSKEISIDVAGHSEPLSEIKLRAAQSKGPLILVQSSADERNLEKNLRELPNVKVVKLSDLRKLLSKLVEEHGE